MVNIAKQVIFRPKVRVDKHKSDKGRAIGITVEGVGHVGAGYRGKSFGADIGVGKYGAGFSSRPKAFEAYVGKNVEGKNPKVRGIRIKKKGR